MPETADYLFASYSMKDRAEVVPFIEALQEVGVRVFYDATLQPGQQWEQALLHALDHAAGLLIFVSPNSMQSEWVRRELTKARDQSKLILPILLKYTPDLPPEVRERQWLDLSKAKTKVDRMQAAARIAEALPKGKSRKKVSLASKPDARHAVQQFAAELREEQRPQATKTKRDSVFVVHGHDTKYLNDVVSFFKGIEIRPVVLKSIRGPSQSLFQKFLKYGREAQFAVILLSADDLGASRRQFDTEGVAQHALQFRARQNVILELGFFYGRLGWENVFVLIKDADKVFPNFERPSDLDGVIFEKVDEAGEWMEQLLAWLTDAGFAVKNLS
jgi:predicted nucleotide-binding protein